MAKRSRPSKTFAVCIDNAGYPASLQAGKLYEVVSDQKAEKHGLLRVVDESGEDYGYSAERFFILAVPLALEKVLSNISLVKQLSPASRRRNTSTAKATPKNKPSQKPLAIKDTVRPEYDFSRGIRGKHATKYAEGTKGVVVKPDSGRAR